MKKIKLSLREIFSKFRKNKVQRKVLRILKKQSQNTKILIKQILKKKIFL
jgi:hypothetical protein